MNNDDKLRKLYESLNNNFNKGINIANKKQQISSNNNKKSNPYQYYSCPMEEVVKKPEEFIIPECLPACKCLWDKNIETYMTSNYDDKDVYYVLINSNTLSVENLKIFKELMLKDRHYFFDNFRHEYGIRANVTENVALELTELAKVFKIQDTKRYQTEKDFLAWFQTIDGKYVLQEDGSLIRLKNPKLADVTFEEALLKSGKSYLYKENERKVFDNELFYNWHEKYLRETKKELDKNK